MNHILIIWTVFALVCPMARGAQEMVTFYTSYGYREIKDATPADEWIIPVRLRVWEFGTKERLIQEEAVNLLVKLAKKFGHRVDPATRARLSARLAAFLADNESGESVRVRFDAIPGKTYAITGENGGSDKDGRLDGVIRLPVADLKAVPADGWLAFSAEGGHQGTGRARLLENHGISIISDIDDTVKVTEIRDGPAMVIMNTFFREFEAAEGMQPLYAANWPGAAFHYVSGGPWQLYTPIADFLRDTQFPEGSLHMRDFPLHPFNDGTWDTLPEQILDPSATFDHKVREISTLMKRFPRRQFILIGDSGEKDPEIYREIEKQFGPQVLKIIIRDVANEPERLKGMEVIQVE